MKSFLQSMKAKKKREVDPNAPPRPNLLTHDKQLRDMQLVAESQANLISQLQRRIDSLETKISNQNAYLSQLHQFILKK